MINPSDLGKEFGLMVWKLEEKIPFINNFFLLGMSILIIFLFLTNHPVRASFLIGFTLGCEILLVLYTYNYSLHAHVNAKIEWRKK